MEQQVKNSPSHYPLIYVGQLFSNAESPAQPTSTGLSNWLFSTTTAASTTEWRSTGSISEPDELRQQLQSSK